MKAAPARLIELKLGATGGAFVLPGSSNAVVAGMRDLYLVGAITPEHVTAARISVSAAVIRMACGRITDEEIDELERNVAAAERARQAGDFQERTRHHQAFHVLLARCTHNPILIATTEGIMEITRQFVQGVDGVRVARAIDFAAVHAHAPQVAKGQLTHGQPVLRRAERARLVPGTPGGQDVQAVEPQHIQRRLHQQSVRTVRRIECAAEQADPSYGHRPVVRPPRRHQTQSLRTRKSL